MSHPHPAAPPPGPGIPPGFGVGLRNTMTPAISTSALAAAVRLGIVDTVRLDELPRAIDAQGNRRVVWHLYGGHGTPPAERGRARLLGATEFLEVIDGTHPKAMMCPACEPEMLAGDPIFEEHPDLLWFAAADDLLACTAAELSERFDLEDPESQRCEFLAITVARAANLTHTHPDLRAAAPQVLNILSEQLDQACADLRNQALVSLLTEARLAGPSLTGALPPVRANEQELRFDPDLLDHHPDARADLIRMAEVLWEDTTWVFTSPNPLAGHIQGLTGRLWVALATRGHRTIADLMVTPEGEDHSFLLQLPTALLDTRGGRVYAERPYPVTGSRGTYTAEQVRDALRIMPTRRWSPSTDYTDALKALACT